MTFHAACKGIMAWFFGSPEYERLAGAIKETRINLEHDGPYDAVEQSDWKAAADKFLDQAESDLNAWNIQQGWIALAAAQRFMLLNLKKRHRVLRAGLVLRREADKVTGWRADAIADLLDGIDELCETAEDVDERVIDAIALRDDSANTTYFKILLRRRSLFQLFLLLWSGVFICTGLSALGVLPAPFNNVQHVAAVIVFGILGATLSVALGLLRADVSAKIPAQQIGSFIVWMRPAIGAAAALVAFALLHANTKLHILNTTTFDPNDFSVIAVIAFVAGFSERFIVGAIERISKLSDKEEDAGKAKIKNKDKAKNAGAGKVD